MGRKSFFLLSLLCCCTSLSASADAPDGSQLDEIVVTATLRATPQIEWPGSVSVLSAASLRDAGQQHIEDVIALVPNLTWAGDTSRPRYFQVRGVGELQQYQGAPNPSVGFLIDDIDFSGIGSVATLFDVDRIEVLHGPQGTLYGANALAGLIYVKSTEPSSTFGGRAEFDVGDYRERSFGAVLTGPVDAWDSAFRLAVQEYTSNGYYYNAYLMRPTDTRDELTARAKWLYQPSDRLRVDLTLLRLQMNDGFDAWSIDDTRTVQSDHPGVDRQYSTGLSARATYTGMAPLKLTTIATYADSTVDYGFDGDWGNPIKWAPYTFDYTEIQIRRRSTRSLESRLEHSKTHGLSWLFGVYGFALREGLSDFSSGLYVDPFDPTQNARSSTVLNSRFQSQSGALYGQLEGDPAPDWRFSVGLRGERHTARYNDLTTNLDAPSTANDFAPRNGLWGGHASLDFTIADGQHVYALISRGYKAGGFNLSPGLAAGRLLFSPEWLLNYEVGHKAQVADGTLQIDTSIFYMARHQEQLLTGEQLVANNPNTFIYYTGNARSGRNYGVESSFAWRAADRLELGGSVGCLQTLYHGFQQNGVTLADRALPNAPDWQAALNATWRDARGPYARLDVTGSGGFYFDLPPNPTRSRPYGLLNGKAGWQTSRIEIYLWVRNLLNKDYPVRGFYFGDQPPDFANRQYLQLGEPRHGGLHGTVRF